jgi:signal transduction histidine kinase
LLSEIKELLSVCAHACHGSQREALTSAAKHARASVVQVHAEVTSGALRIQARDDATGGADPGLAVFGALLTLVLPSPRAAT